MNRSLSFLDSPIAGAEMVPETMRKTFSAEAFITRCVEVEVALAKVQADLGIIPVKAATGIGQAAQRTELDYERLVRETEIVGYPILPLVEQLAAASEHGRYLHWGATTQDIMDSATVLQVRTGLDEIQTLLDRCIPALAKLAEDHRTTVMAGRTHLQQALPVTFGYKAAVWLSGLLRHRERLAQLRPRVEVVQFSGASGTLASLGSDGIAVQDSLAVELGLGSPIITWHSMRDSMAETVQFLALLCGSLEKIAFDISIMAMTELGEAAEPFSRHRGASSTMPQKRNPISCERIIAAAKMVRQHAGLMLDAMAHDFERATGPWHLEWSAVPESFALTAGALEQAVGMLEGLHIDAQAMRRNLDRSNGLILAEAVMMALAPFTGRQQAHDLVYAACQASSEADISLFDELRKEPRITAHLDAQRLDELADPANYLGSVESMIDRVIEAHSSSDNQARH